jgi:predicted small secreted protein
MKKLAKAAVAVLISLNLVVLAGCNTVGDVVNDVGQGVSDALGQLISGDVTGEVGKDYRTQWFSFKVDSITKVDEYTGITALPGNELIDVVITEKNIFDESIPMGTWDFYVDAPSFPEYIFPLDPVDDTMMPLDFELAPDESATYHMVFEVPVDTTDLVLVYVEIDETESIGATFTIKIDNL